ncbi:unnamed protein product [Triticum turgidum subsp. durum]|uniref:Glycosyltransferase n=1 Tax=Triticum turgidum subsp. durum TaxID=4567 RepID=A0A9R0U1A4_TRITD|nr:unnamed protein product [Triticum turgidum subsp. durum]
MPTTTTNLALSAVQTFRVSTTRAAVSSRHARSPIFAMEADSSPSPLRVVVVPWLAFGHLLPYLELSERLAERGHSVSYVSTPRNLARLPPVRPAAAPRVDLVALPLPRVDGLPDGPSPPTTSPTASVSSTGRPSTASPRPSRSSWPPRAPTRPPGLTGSSPTASTTGPPPPPSSTRFGHPTRSTKYGYLLAGLSFHACLISSSIDHQVPLAMLQPTAASIAAAQRPPSVHPDPDASVVEQPGAAAARAVPRYEREGHAAFTTGHGASSGGMSVVQRFILTKDGSTVAAMRSCIEWEPETFPLAETLLGKPVIPLGLLPPSAEGARRAAAQGEEHATEQWLNAQPPDSVIYVALGSEVPLRVEQVHEMAFGLELAGTRFLWALRKPSGAADDDSADMLPPGFQDRTSGRGLVTTGWVPQMSILAHAAVGGFLTHCGRNSLIESLLFGHPLVMLPIYGDQGPNARQMEAKQVGLQVARNEDDGSFDRHGVSTAVRAVMVEEEARRGFVAGAAKIQAVVADTELHGRYIDEFVEHLRSYAAASAN